MRSAIFVSAVYLFDEYTLDPVARQLHRSGDNVYLTSRLFDLLELLLQKHGELVSKDELIDRVWPGQIVDENNLTVCICELRKRLRHESSDRRYLETVPKRGYRFTRPVELLDDSLNRNQTTQAAKPKSSNTISSAQALAVLPIVNHSGVRKLEFVSDGLTETLINSLSRVEGLRVVAYHVISRYTNSDRDLREIAKELNVDVILTGRIILRNQPYISVELIDVKSGFQLASKSLEIDATDLLRVQKEILRQTVETLGLPRAKVTTSTSSSDAHVSYLKGRYFFSIKSVTATRRAIEYFRRAVRYDMRYPLAYTGLADCYSRLSTYGVDAPRKFIPKAKQFIQKALEIDDGLAEAHASLARIRVNYDWDWAGAKSEFQRALDLNPEYAPGYQLYAEHMARTGAFDEALEMVGKAVELDPLARSLMRSTGMILYLARRYDVAAQMCVELLEMDPGYLPAIALQGVIYAAQEEYDLAIPRLKQVVETASREDNGSVKRNPTSKRRESVRPPPAVLEIVGALGYVYARSGKRRSAQKLLKELEIYSKDVYVEPHAFAVINIGLGNFDEAFRWLARSHSDRSFILTFLNVWPFFDPIRSDRRFDELADKVKFG